MGKLTAIANYYVNFLNCDIKETSAGKPYRLGSCAVIRNSKEEAEILPYRHWEQGLEIPLGIYNVKGGFQVYEGTEQFVLQADPIPVNEIAEWMINAFTKKSPDSSITPEFIAMETCNALGMIKSEFIRKLTATCLIASCWDWFKNSYQDNWNSKIKDLQGRELEALQDESLLIYKMWGAKKIHHDYLGGLMHHSLEVLDVSNQIRQIMMGPDGLSQRQKDILVSTSLIHDVGKMYEYDISSGSCVTSDLGRFHDDHIFLGVRLVERVYRIIENDNPVCDDPMILEEIVHTIMTHHGQWFKPIKPRTFVAKLVQAGDLNSAAIARGRDFFLRDKDAETLDDHISTFIKTK